MHCSLPIQCKVLTVHGTTFNNLELSARMYETHRYLILSKLKVASLIFNHSSKSAEVPSVVLLTMVLHYTSLISTGENYIVICL